MTVEQLHDAIGMIDDSLVEETDRLRTASRKKRLGLRRYVSLAACLAVLICGGFAFWFANNALRCGSAAPQMNSMDAAAPAEMPASGAARSAPESAQEKSVLTGEAAASAESGANNAAPESAMDQGAVSGENEMEPRPPALSAGTLTVLSSSYSWTLPQDDGTTRTIVACGAAPQDQAEKLPALTAEEGTLALSWNVLPEGTAALCWRTENAPEAQPETAAYEDGVLTLRPGDWIYEVSADFDQGQARYVFRAVWEQGS